MLAEASFACELCGDYALPLVAEAAGRSALTSFVSITYIGRVNA